MSSVIGLKVRASILRTPGDSPGLLFLDGRQWPFTLDNVWKSPVAPRVDMAVDVDFDGQGNITAITAVDQQQAAKEKLEQIGDAAQQHGKEAAKIASQGIGALAARMGKVTLAATVILWIAWFFLPAFTIGVSISAISKSFTFWDLVGLDPNTNIVTTPASHGLFGLLGLLAIAAPFASPFIGHPKAKFLYAMPLVYIVIAVFVIQSDLKAFFAHIFGATLVDAAKWLSFSVSYGGYVLAVASLFVAAQVLRRPGYANAGGVPAPPAAGGVS